MESARLRRKVAELEVERETLEGRGRLRPGDGAVNRRVLCKVIAAEKTAYGARRLCREYGTTSTTFYAGRPAPVGRWSPHSPDCG